MLSQGNRAILQLFFSVKSSPTAFTTSLRVAYLRKPGFRSPNIRRKTEFNAKCPFRSTGKEKGGRRGRECRGGEGKERREEGREGEGTGPPIFQNVVAPLVTSDGISDHDIKQRIGKAKTVFGDMKNVLLSRIISLTTKLRVLLYVLLYGCETWTVSKTIKDRLVA